MQLFYVDRFEINGRPEMRAFPLFTNWTSQTLRDRQKRELDDGYFGGGSLCDPIEIPAEHYKDVSRGCGGSNNDGGDKDGESGYEESVLGRKIMKETLFIASRLEVLKKMIGDAPISELRKKEFSDSVVAAQKILGINIDLNVQATRDEAPNVPRKEDAFFYRDDVFDLADQASAGVKDNNEEARPSKNTNPIEAPNFDLLETQIEKDAPPINHSPIDKNAPLIAMEQVHILN